MTIRLVIDLETPAAHPELRAAELVAELRRLANEAENMDVSLHFDLEGYWASMQEARLALAAKREARA